MLSWEWQAELYFTISGWSHVIKIILVHVPFLFFSPTPPSFVKVLDEWVRIYLGFTFRNWTFI